MKSWEKNIVVFLKKHGLVIFTILLTLLSMYQRYNWRAFITGDTETYILPWISELAARGGIFALGEKIPNCNYNVPYVLLLAFISYLPDTLIRLYAVKAVSIAADIACAVLAVLILKEIDVKTDKLKMFLCYGLVLCSPQFMTNGALWGQCDSVYTLFTLIGIYLMFKEKYGLAMFSFGISFAFKLQFIFIIPAIIIIYAVNQRFSVLKTVWFAVGYFVSILPAVVQGRSIIDIINVYVGQTSYTKRLEVWFPNIWYLISGDYDALSSYGMVTAIMIFMIVAVWLFYTADKLEKKDIVLLSIWSVFTCVMFLPNMHERYGFVAIALAIIYAFVDKKSVWAAVAANMIVLPIYFNFVFGMELIGYKLLSFIMLAIYCAYTVWVIKLGQKEKLPTVQ